MNRLSSIKDWIIKISKGIFIGVGTLIPGVSGGTAAIVTGVFEGLLYAFSNIFKNFFGSLKFISPIGIGIILGICTSVYPIKFFCVHFPVLSNYIFCFISLISTIIFVKKTLRFNCTVKKVISVFSGVFIAFSISYITIYFQFSNEDMGIIGIILIGILLSIALVLPAISFSYMLLFFGLYERTLDAISSMDLYFLIPLVIGVLSGSFIFSKLLLKAINEYQQETYSFILGFVLCSLIEIVV